MPAARFHSITSSAWPLTPPPLPGDQIPDVRLGPGCQTSDRADTAPAAAIDGAAAGVYHRRTPTEGKAVMRRLTILLGAVAIAASTSAYGKMRLAQTSATTTCMMGCNSTYANCQSSCLATGGLPSTSAVSATPNPIRRASGAAQPAAPVSNNVLAHYLELIPGTARTIRGMFALRSTMDVLI